jgi:hypothetical protein
LHDRRRRLPGDLGELPGLFDFFQIVADAAIDQVEIGTGAIERVQGAGVTA